MEKIKINNFKRILKKIFEYFYFIIFNFIRYLKFNKIILNKNYYINNTAYN